ncbi:tyrosyl-tRNA synthetase [Klebsiella pneumoniae subsp. ozaenae]|uniref:Tyrosyl-tRNA synthetase n=1 Tax=Klebsiella pneumoniae subsp. ozaenae TaxID=574 RepID=A0A378B4G4_KLEPO|nr:tyrosyl-tRNA synthetase [Klebsiella pneumoniae subsp. ozaenae]
MIPSWQPSAVRRVKTVASNAVTINGEKQADPEYVFSDSDRLFGRYTLLRRGKKITAWSAGNKKNTARAWETTPFFFLGLW